MLSLYLDSDDFAPILALLAEDGTLLGTTAGQPSASLEGLEVPFDLILMLEVLADTPEGAGAYTLRVEQVE